MLGYGRLHGCNKTRSPGAFFLVFQLISHVRIAFSHLVTVQQDSYFASAIAQPISGLLHFLSGSKGHLESLVLDQDVHLRTRRLVLFDAEGSDCPKFPENRVKVLLICVLWVVPHRRVDHRYQVVLDLVLGVVGHHIPTF